jgi:hypothetical protein
LITTVHRAEAERTAEFIGQMRARLEQAKRPDP